MDSLRANHSREASVAECDGPGERPTVWGVAEYYYPNFSGAAIQAHRILSRLASFNLRVKMLTVADQAAASQVHTTHSLDDVEITYLPVIRQRDWSAIHFFPRPLRQWMMSFNQSLRDWSFQRAIVHQLRRQAKPGDILQLYVVGDWTWITLRAARPLGMRAFIQISLIGADDPSSFRRSWLGISTWLKKRCFFQVEQTIGLSRALTHSCHMAGLSHDRVMRIPNGVDLEQFPVLHWDLRQATCLRLAYPPDRLRVIFVGSAIVRKGIDVAIGAFRLLAKELPDIDLLIVGPCDFSDRTRHGVERDLCLQKLRAELQQDQLSDRVHWVGQVENVSDYLLASDIFFFPTRREGLPNALAEAMACGLPVVASRLDGITTDLVNDGQEGFLVAGHSPVDYLGSLRRLCQDQDLRGTMGRAGRQRIETEFQLDQVVAQYAQLYQQRPTSSH